VSHAVVFDGVSFTYPGAPDPALSEVSFGLEEGSFVLVTGPTGAGKSTLIRAMNGLVPHFSGGSLTGSVTVAGRRTLDLPPRKLADIVGFVPQDPGAAFVVDRVEDELAYGMENLGVPAATMRRRAEEVMDLLAIESLRNRSVRALSGGERQRVAIAAALTTAPRLLLLDEPTSQLDPQGAEDVLAALQRLVHDLGLTVVVAEHRLERVAGFVDLALGCSPGGKVVLGSPAETLGRVGTGPPVTRLGRMLGWSPAPLTVREARRMVAGTNLGAPVAGDSRGDASDAPGEGPAAQVEGHLSSPASRRSHRQSPPQPPTPPGPRLRPAAAPAVPEGSPSQARVPLVRAQSLVAAHGDREVLSGLDVGLCPGEIVALVGRNGSGKTTLLRCLSGLHPPARGTVETAAGGRPAPGLDVALCPQDPDMMLFCETVREEIEATLAAKGLRGGAGALAGPLGLRDLLESHPRDLSAGERLLVAAAAVVASGAPVLLLDEPTRGLDVESKGRLGAFLRSLAATGHGVMFASHDVELVAEVATRVLMLAGGELLADGHPAEVMADSPVFSPQMARVFGAPWMTPEQVAMAVRGR